MMGEGRRNVKYILFAGKSVARTCFVPGFTLVAYGRMIFKALIGDIRTDTKSRLLCAQNSHYDLCIHVIFLVSVSPQITTIMRRRHNLNGVKKR